MSKEILALFPLKLHFIYEGANSLLNLAQYLLYKLTKANRLKGGIYHGKHKTC